MNESLSESLKEKDFLLQICRAFPITIRSRIKENGHRLRSESRGRPVKRCNIKTITKINEKSFSFSFVTAKIVYPIEKSKS